MPHGTEGQSVIRGGALHTGDQGLKGQMSGIYPIGLGKLAVWFVPSRDDWGPECRSWKRAEEGRRGRGGGMKLTRVRTGED